MKTILLLLISVTFSRSLFDAINENNVTETDNNSVVNIEQQLNELLNNVKAGIKTDFLKNSFSYESVAKYLEQFIESKETANSAEIANQTETRTLKVTNKLTADIAKTKDLQVEEFVSHAFDATKQSITFKEQSFIVSNKRAMKTEDLPNVILFAKYVTSICGPKLENCDFNKLAKVDVSSQIKEAIKDETNRSYEKAAKELADFANSFLARKEVQLEPKKMKFKELPSDEFEVNNASQNLDFSEYN